MHIGKSCSSLPVCIRLFHCTWCVLLSVVAGFAVLWRTHIRAARIRESVSPKSLNSISRCGARLGGADCNVFAQRARMASPVASLPGTYLIGVKGYKIHQKSVSESSISARYGHGPPLQSYGAIRREHTSRAVACLYALTDAWLFKDDLIPS